MSSKRRSGPAGLPDDFGDTPDPKRRKRNDVSALHPFISYTAPYRPLHSPDLDFDFAPRFCTLRCRSPRARQCALPTRITLPALRPPWPTAIRASPECTVRRIQTRLADPHCDQDTYFPTTETAESTTELGLKLVGQLKKSHDKSGRNVAVHFIDLPSRDEYPDYYESTAMPLSLNTIEQKLENLEYENMEKLESDLKRMVQNAKDYNHVKSPIFEDAERIRKALSNFMPKHNPAYLRPDYRAYPTPIPQDLEGQPRGSTASSEVAAPPEKVKLVFSSKRRQSGTARSTPAETKVSPGEEQLKFLEELSAQEDAM